jgi:hypothetical protein
MAPRIFRGSRKQKANLYREGVLEASGLSGKGKGKGHPIAGHQGPSGGVEV